MVQMNTVLEKLSSSARELSYYHSGEGNVACNFPLKLSERPFIRSLFNFYLNLKSLFPATFTHYSLAFRNLGCFQILINLVKTT